jgi:hypothetical protein
MKHKNIFNHKNIFLFTCLGGLIYCKIILPYILFDKEKEIIKRIPTEFLGLYIVDTSSTSTIAFPLIPTFHN